MMYAAGLLTFPSPFLPVAKWQQWLRSKKVIPMIGMGITAAGTVPDLHRIPF
jgi:hypothetical protein